MGSHQSIPYVGRGSTVNAACQDLTEQLQKHISISSHVKISNPLSEPTLSPRARSPRYPGPFVAMAVVGDGKDHNVVLERIPGDKNQFSATVMIK